MVSTHLEVLPQLPAGITATKTVCAQHREAAGDKFTELIGVGLLVVGRGDEWPFSLGELRGEVRRPRRLSRMQSIPTHGVVTVAGQFVHAREAPDIRGDAEIALKHLGSRLHLSCFDGAHAFLFSAALEGETLRGDFWSRDSYHTTWTAAKDAGAALPDDFALTRWTGDEIALASLSFPDVDGTPRRLDDPAFTGDARLLVVFGSWCPNCNDLSEYLVELDARYEGLSILGLAFEYGDDLEAQRAAVRDYLAHHGASYPALVCGTVNKEKASAALPILDRVRAYPTTVFMDGQGRVSAVHTGFSGPATGERHQRLRERFESEIESLLGRAGAGATPSPEQGGR